MLWRAGTVSRASPGATPASTPCGGWWEALGKLRPLRGDFAERGGLGSARLCAILPDRSAGARRERGAGGPGPVAKEANGQRAATSAVREA